MVDMKRQRSASEKVSRAKVAAAVLLPVASSAVALVAGTAPAGADPNKVQSWTFTDVNGLDHTCSITTTWEYPFNGDSEVGRGGTATSGDPACTNAVASITATYSDPDGNAVVTSSNHASASVERRFAPIGSAFKTFHDVSYNACSANCTFHTERTK
jgi:hypothetical protein